VPYLPTLEASKVYIDHNNKKPYETELQLFVESTVSLSVESRKNLGKLGIKSEFSCDSRNMTFCSYLLAITEYPEAKPTLNIVEECDI
jgi:hypothetical protein